MAMTSANRRSVTLDRNRFYGIENKALELFQYLRSLGVAASARSVVRGTCRGELSAHLLADVGQSASFAARQDRQNRQMALDPEIRRFRL